MRVSKLSIYKSGFDGRSFDSFDGLSGRVGRIKGLGNAVVPQVVMKIGLAILGAERAMDGNLE